MSNSVEFIESILSKTQEISDSEYRITTQDVEELITKIAIVFGNAKGMQRDTLIEICSIALEHSMMQDYAMTIKKEIDMFVEMGKKDQAEKDGKVQ